MTCPHCGSSMEPDRVLFCSCNVARPLMIENTPAQVCAQCGYKVFDEGAIEVFEKIRDSGIPHSRLKLIEVFEFEAALAYESAPTETVRPKVIRPGNGGFAASFPPSKQHYALFGKSAPVGERLAS